MAKEKKKKQFIPTKKHLAREQREKRQVLYLTIAVIAVVMCVVGVIGYGYLDQEVLQGKRALITVNGEKFSVNDFRSFTKYYRYTQIQQADGILNIAQMFGPEMTQNFTSQLTQIMNNMDAFRSGQIAIDQITQSLLLRQEAERRGISISQEELDKYTQELLGYFPDGTPTPTTTPELLPTSTLSAQQISMMPPEVTEAVALVPTDTTNTELTETPSLAFTPTATSILTPTATATVYTQDAFQENYDKMITDFEENFEIPQNILLFIFEAQLYRQKLFEQITADLDCVQEQVWAQHILVADEGLAKDIHNRLEEGEDWTVMAATYSLDEGNKNENGDLGWFGSGQMVPPFEETAFSLDIGEISDPVQTDFGWHIIRIIGHEDNSLTASACNEYQTHEFQLWVNEMKENSEIETMENWQSVVPLLPAMPQEMESLINQITAPQVIPTPNQ